jgi:predicted AlkP superfamily pyrophosphatase or phosphodiesterase
MVIIRPVRVVCLCFVMVSLILSPLAQVRPRGRGEVGSGQTRTSIRLVVGIVIDQFRYDYLTRFEDQFVEGGFRRFLQRGANFTDNNYLHTPTYTAPGHATFMSGTTPALNGIVGNEWYDRATGREVSSVSDSKVRQLGGREGATGASPHRLIGSTIGDQLKLVTQGRAKVVGVSLKDRSAILPAGKRPNGAYWYDGNTGNFVSSTWYFGELPAWVRGFNRDHHSDKYFDRTWERLLPEAAYGRSAGDDNDYEGKDHLFPHSLRGKDEKPGPSFYGRFQASPFANDHLADLALAAIENEGLGKDEVPDLLTVSFSSNDLVGHAFGPHSQEVQDITLRTDRTIARLFEQIDRKVGLQHVLFALTADHGVAPVPEQVKALGYGGRVGGSEVRRVIDKALDARYGDEEWILSTGNGNVYFDLEVIARKKVDVGTAETIAAAAVLGVPGIAACFTRSQIVTGQTPATRLAQSVVLGFHPERNGNLVVVTEPFYLVGGSSGTSHGTPYSYDTHVPLLLLGPGVRPGWYSQSSSPADIAPTIAALLGLNPPSNRTGRILGEALLGFR